MFTAPTGTSSSDTVQLLSRGEKKESRRNEDEIARNSQGVLLPCQDMLYTLARSDMSHRDVICVE